MADKLREREKGYEAKYKLDEELRFKAESRRNKLLGLWAAERMGLPKAEHESYAKEVVIADFDEPGSDDVIRRVQRDFATRGLAIDEAQIREQLARFHALALEQVAKEFPRALETDHESAAG